MFAEAPLLGDLPDELLSAIFQKLPGDAQLNAGLVSRRLMRILTPQFQRLSDLRLVLEDGYCTEPSVKFEHAGSTVSGNFLLTLTACQCSEHARAHCVLLRAILEAAGSVLREIIVEDYLLKQDCFMTEETLDAILTGCSELMSLELHHVDLSLVTAGTVARIRNFKGLNQLALDQCCQKKTREPNGLVLTDRMLVGINAAGTLRQLQVTLCQSVTDRALKALAQTCPKLWYADFSGCKKVTAKGVAHFCLCLAAKETDMSYLKIFQTSVTGSQLQRYLLVPLGEDCVQKWVFTKIQVDVGWGQACCVQDRELPTKSLIVFI